MKKKGKSHAFLPRGERAPYRQWGSGFEPGSIEQMENACSLPVAVAGALMPDAHRGRRKTPVPPVSRQGAREKHRACRTECGPACAALPRESPRLRQRRDG